MYWIRLLKLSMVGPKVPNEGEGEKKKRQKKEKLTLDPHPFLLFVRTIYLAIFGFVHTNESFFFFFWFGSWETGVGWVIIHQRPEKRE
jgi:hypothetical protein